MSSRLNFEVQATSPGSKARATRFKTLHNEVLGPLFMPVGTHAAVRHIAFDELELAGSQILLTNTLHLTLRPGAEVFKKFGGIHGLTKWKRSFLTDSGGFQIFSMPEARRMTEEGAQFRSYVDGTLISLSPELSIEMQKTIGSDIMMVLDECIPSTSPESEARRAMELTHRWALRSLAARGDSQQSLFGIIQGACYEHLRRESAEFLTAQPFDGFAIGGLAVGESKAEREHFTNFATSLMPADRPRYLMGVGTPIDLLEGVHNGVDMFDCIIPTSHGEQGLAYTFKGRVRLPRGTYKFAEEPIQEGCPCPACKNYSRAYLHHLIKVEDSFGRRMVATHNVYFFHVLMAKMRAAIFEGKFLELYNELRQVLDKDDLDNPPERPAPAKAPKDYSQLGDYRVVANPSGTYSIQQISSGEVMHSVLDPNEEARALYVEQSGVLEKLQKNESAPLVVWDVGMGAAHNAMALIHATEKLQKTRSLQIESFEIDLDSIKLAMQNPKLFPHIRHGGPATVVKQNEWQHKTLPISWKLFDGAFEERFQKASQPDVIFFDPFSFKVDSKLWTLEFLSDLKKSLSDGANSIHDSVKNPTLYTYSASTSVRITLLLAGFYVYRGNGTGPKSETTWASLHPIQELEVQRLDHEFIEKCKRSDAFAPRSSADASVWSRENVLSQLIQHPQFS